MANKSFKPKAPAYIGQIVRMLVSVKDLCGFFGVPKNIFPSQRDHGKNQKKKTHTRGMLWGNAQQFAAVYVEERRCFFTLDGHHRIQSLTEGNAWFAPRADLELSVHRVATFNDAEQLYSQYNSAVAAKKSGCYFESGYRLAGIKLKSLWTTSRGVTTAVQYAADIFGTVATKNAVVKVQNGLVMCDKLNLPMTKHVTSGVKGALIAIAQHAANKELARLFIKNVCSEEYDVDRPTYAERAILFYRDNLMLGKYGGSGGGTSATTTKFEEGLGAFVAFCLRSRGSKVMAPSSYTLAEFIEQMNSWSKKAA